MWDEGQRWISAFKQHPFYWIWVPTRHSEHVSKQLSRAPKAVLTHGCDRLLAGTAGSNLGFAFSGGNHEKFVSAHSRLRTEGWISLPPRSCCVSRSHFPSLSLVLFHSYLPCHPEAPLPGMDRGARLCLLFVMTILCCCHLLQKWTCQQGNLPWNQSWVSAGSVPLLSPLSCKSRGNLLWVFWTMNVFLAM